MNNTCCGHKNPLFIYELIDNSHIWLCAACVLFVYVKRTHSYVARYAGTHFTFVREIRPWRHRDISFAILFFFNFLSVHRFTLSVYASELQASLFFYLFFGNYIFCLGSYLSYYPFFWIAMMPLLCRLLWFDSSILNAMCNGIFFSRWSSIRRTTNVT